MVKMFWSVFLLTTDTLLMAIGASKFNDEPEGGGDRATQYSTPKMPLHRRHLVELPGTFLLRMSNTVTFRRLSVCH